jgi:hypothetical protein
MPGFDTLGARLARSRRRLERERAAVKCEQSGREGAISIPGPRDRATVGEAASAAMATSAQIILFPRQNGHDRD